MNADNQKSWEVYNQEYLDYLISHLVNSISKEKKLEVSCELAIEDNQELPAIERLCEKFSLSSFEKDLLLLVAAVELNTEYKQILLKNTQNCGCDYLTLSYALSVLSDAHWDSVTPVASLRYWHLIEVIPSFDLMDSRLKINEKILHYLVGINYVDEQLAGFISQNKNTLAIVPSHVRLATQIVDQWDNVSGREYIAQLIGNIGNGIKSVCQEIANQVDYDFYTLNACAIPQTFVDRQLFIRLYQRETILNNILLLLDLRGISDFQIIENAKEFVISVQRACFIATGDDINLSSLGCSYYEVDKPDPNEQKQLWNHVIGELTVDSNITIEHIISQFNLGPSDVLSASQIYKEKDPQGKSPELLWTVCQEITRSNIQGLAQRVIPKSSWQDLVLPDAQKETLFEIAAHLRQRKKVYETWGFANKSSLGLGITALFSGESGTGKTMSAETLAKELELDLYRIDLSSVVSKYIGETEKNLRRIFDAAEISGAILLFDEADALFGKRSEVKDSHDRYANIEVSYLLQRMEAYRGLAILTTNLSQSLDPAFIRRIRFIVHFPYPNEAHRKKIWQGIFPKQAPVKDLELNKLAQLNLAGGNIKNIAMSAAFLAADEDNPISMSHLFHATRSECNKLERPLTDLELEGWRS